MNSFKIMLFSLILLTMTSSASNSDLMYDWFVVRLESGKVTTMSFKGESSRCGKVVVDPPRTIADFGNGVIENIEVEPQMCYNVSNMGGGVWETGHPNSWITRTSITLAKVHGGSYSCSVDWKYIGSSPGPVDVMVLFRLIPEECEKYSGI